jgi:hypothetical protein
LPSLVVRFLPSFGSFGQAVSEEKIFFKSANQKQELPMAAMFVNGSGQMSNLYRGPSIDTSYQVSKIANFILIR